MGQHTYLYAMDLYTMGGKEKRIFPEWPVEGLLA